MYGNNQSEAQMWQQKLSQVRQAPLATSHNVPQGGPGIQGQILSGLTSSLAGGPLAGFGQVASMFFNEGGQVPPQLMEMLQQAPPEVQQAVQAFLQGQIGPEELAQVLQQAGIPPEMIQQVMGMIQQASQGAPQEAPQGPPQGLNRGGKAQPSLAEQINWGGKYDKPKKDGPKRSWYDPRGWVNKNDGGMIGHNPDTFIDGKIASVHYPTPGTPQNTAVSLNKGGPISINPANKGQFTNRAQSAGMGTQEYARKVMSSPEGEYSPQVRRQANFARNASKWNSGGYIMGQPHQMSTTGYNDGGRVPYSSTLPRGPLTLNRGGSAQMYNDGGEVDIVMQESSSPVKSIKQKAKRGHNEDSVEISFDTAVPPMSEMAMKGLGIV